MQRMEWDTWVRFLLSFTVDMVFMKMGLKEWEMPWEETERSKVARATTCWPHKKRLRTKEPWNYLTFLKVTGTGTDSWVWGVNLNGKSILGYCCLSLWVFRKREREWIAYLALYCCSLQGVLAAVCPCALITWSLPGNNVHHAEVLWEEGDFVKTKKNFVGRMDWLPLSIKLTILKCD